MSQYSKYQCSKLLFIGRIKKRSDILVQEPRVQKNIFRLSAHTPRVKFNVLSRKTIATIKFLKNKERD